ncbi:hypothetical protein C9J12_21080 [Photobacterium frigidiphilum]|uniref:ParB-like N-terminal domain-containing protein n=1 Tax=Photobacterium frigidiphilum TaxID=264736 RepID=A0A2T3JA64_9GAMM|nr:ParB/RepB/Spo0J family partition protein [Photobacterium frigidiphilum]PSU45739.1 hypothetical protein C9J12_21080 [Photobacterium frigidiphilum]
MAKRPDRSLKTIVEGVSTSKIDEANRLHNIRQKKLESKSPFIELPLGTRTVSYELVTIPYNDIEKSTLILESNAREQAFLNKETLSDILETMQTDGQQFPAIGQRVNNNVIVIDGSRRRASCLIAKKDFLIYVTDDDISDEEANFQSTVGNAHKQISIYEHGMQWIKMLDAGVCKDPKELAIYLRKSDSIVYDAINALDISKELLLSFPAASELGRPAFNKLRKALNENQNIDLDDIIIHANEHHEVLHENVAITLRDKNKKHLDYVIKLINSYKEIKKSPKAKIIKGINQSSARVIITPKGYNIILEKLSEQQKKELDNMLKTFLNT